MNETKVTFLLRVFKDRFFSHSLINKISIIKHSVLRYKVASKLKQFLSHPRSQYPIDKTSPLSFRTRGLAKSLT